MTDQSGNTTKQRILSPLAFLALAGGVGCVLLSTALQSYVWEVIADLIKEIGFALIVAFFIWVLFEYFSQEAAERQWASRIEGITNNVFFGVLRRNLPSELITEAHLLVLDNVFIRTDTHVTYILTDDTYVENAENHPFVLLSAVARFKAKNVGNKSEKYPIRISMPNPLIPALKAKCDITKISVYLNGRPVEMDLEVAVQKFREDLNKDSGAYVPVNIGSVDMLKNDILDVTLGYVMAKEEEDTEVFQTFYPAQTLTFTVLDRSPGRRAVRARSIHRLPLQDDTPDPATGSYHYRINSFFAAASGIRGMVEKAKGSLGTGSPTRR